jgi:hypothetical protein
MLLIKFPSRSRPEKLLSTLSLYRKLAGDLSRIKFLITLDSDDPTVTPELIEKLQPATVIVGVSGSKIKAVNRDMDKAGEFDILLLASDDMIPQVYNYDLLIRSKMTELYPDTDGVLWFNDGFQKNKLNTLSIMGRKYYERFGYIYHPAYMSLFCDNEFMIVADRLRKQTYIDMVIIKHEHPVFTGVGSDSLYVENDKYFARDRDVFKSRLMNNFSDV